MPVHPYNSTPSAATLGRRVFPFALAVIAGCGVEQPASERYADLPFLVSEEYTPSGFMGAGEKPGALTLYHDACPTRPEGALGQCYSFVYDPTLMPEVPWVGVQWQSPANNWGDLPPKRLEPGVTQLRFKLRGSRAGGTVTAEVGGKPAAMPLPFFDTFHRSQACPLTTEWTSCTVDLTGAEYDRVVNAFTWSYAATSMESVTLYFDDLIWE